MPDKNFGEISLIIPAYQPDELLVTLIADLLKYNYGNIVVVNDGSDKSKQFIFDSLQQYPRTTVINLSKNTGKGEALKTGMRWLIKNHSQNILGIITVDADGQHLPKDVEKIAHSLLAHPHAYSLGIRTFDKRVPWRSRFGNNLTRSLFHLLFKVKLADTQTGLRGVPYNLMERLLTINAERYEYEMACLICAVKAKVEIQEVPVDTVYINHNLSSHFNPLVDSIRIYYVFFRYAMQKQACKESMSLRTD